MERQFVAFTIGSEEFCIDISKVREVKEMMPITKVPQAPDEVEGIVNLRGQVIPIVNLKKVLGYYDDNDLSDKKIILVETGNDVVGFIVDDVSDVVSLSEEQIESVPSVIGSHQGHYLRGIAKKDERLLLVFDLSKIINTDSF
ncbi:chemotaxis protein CheW [Thermococcus aciditolerans]|uniref:Purine-binding chemotaxis protein CheW n=1 Tax=Thermococcus aciditolerans TaxID=2598455 RepID=A0A5C0SKX0_9EURY|nr:chemotaxis protein CheW [Thermococcus aciditolerans]QEK14064.1 purine-binding chemotaxis protein CheW [Thermococcus aciditolerans]